jgi:general secretion pathway protein H
MPPEPRREDFPIFMVVQNSRGGFTLLELIVVLVIISLMSALVVPRLVVPMSNLDLKTASKKISASLRYARSQAASEKATCLALFDFDNNRLVIINPTPANGDLSINNQEAIEKMLEEQQDHQKDRPGSLKTYKLPNGVKLAKVFSKEGEVNSGIFPVFFFPSGGSSGGEITVANEHGRQYKVTVDFITGTVQLSEVAG